jgi:hypothetical protein
MSELTKNHTEILTPAVKMLGFIISIIPFNTGFKTGRRNDRNKLREKISALIHIN